MSKWKRPAIGVAGALLVSGGLLIAASPGGAATIFARGYWGPSKHVGSHRLDTGKKGLSIKDQDIGTVRLYKHGKQSGALYFECAFTIVRHDRVRQLCQTDTDIYARGEIFPEGIPHSKSSFLHPITGSSSVLHIIGGTGDYGRHPRGTVTVRFSKHGAHIVYRVKK